MFEFLNRKEVEIAEQSVELVESEFSIAADKINQRIAVTESRIRDELDLVFAKKYCSIMYSRINNDNIIGE